MKLILVLSLALSPLACGKTIDATCEACGAATYTADECTAAGNAAGCRTSVLEQVTDAVCHPTSSPTAHAACAFTGCTKAPDCGS